MSQTVTLNLPDAIARRARAEAERSHRPVEDVLLGWIDQLATEAPIEAMNDEQVLSVCETDLDPGQQSELSKLLGLQQEGRLVETSRLRLEALMTHYRRGLVRKARALKEAVDRGLIPSQPARQGLGLDDLDGVRPHSQR